MACLALFGKAASLAGASLNVEIVVRKTAEVSTADFGSVKKADGVVQVGASPVAGRIVDLTMSALERSVADER